MSYDLLLDEGARVVLRPRALDETAAVQPDHHRLQGGTVDTAAGGCRHRRRINVEVETVFGSGEKTRRWSEHGYLGAGRLQLERI